MTTLEYLFLCCFSQDIGKCACVPFMGQIWYESVFPPVHVEGVALWRSQIGGRSVPS